MDGWSFAVEGFYGLYGGADFYQCIDCWNDWKVIYGLDGVGYFNIFFAIILGTIM